MIQKLFKTIFVFLVLLISGVACSKTSTENIMALQYFNQTVSIIRKRALNSSKVDWKTILNSTKVMLKNAKTSSDTYPAIGYVLTQLNDNHSFIVGGRNDRRIYPKRSLEKLPRTKVQKTRKNSITKNGKLIGYLAIEGISSKNSSAHSKEYSYTIQNSIQLINKQNPIGWIVDLRTNNGGNMWPMIVGLGPLIGNGTLGYFKYSKMKIPWFYDAGKSGIIKGNENKQINFSIQTSVAEVSGDVPIAILINNCTASSGEAVAISFKGRDNTRFFGERTFGLSTSNEKFNLSDGAILYLTTSVECDRNHNCYYQGIEPDVLVNNGEASLDENTINAAVDWIVSKNPSL